MSGLLLSVHEVNQMRSDLESLTMPDTCVIYAVTRTGDGQGGWTESYAASGTVACRIDNTGGQRQTRADSIESFSSYVLTVPQDAGITTLNRVEVNDYTYNVIAVSDGGSWLGVNRLQVELIA